MSSTQSPKSVTREIATLDLGDFQSTVHAQMSHTEGGAVFLATLERSDGRELESVMETKDGRKITRYRPNLWIFADSAESIDQLTRGLSRVIELCGGKPAPF